MGPLAYATAVANGSMWAHWRMLLLLLPMASFQPIENKQLLLPMILRGPISICSCCCRWLPMGPSAYATAAAVDGFIWAH